MRLHCEIKRPTWVSPRSGFVQPGSQAGLRKSAQPLTFTLTGKITGHGVHLQSLAITYYEFCRRARAAGCRALSVNYRPRQEEAASIFSTSLGQLLSDNTYSVHSSNAARTSFTNYNDPNARALRFDEMLGAALLLEQVLAEGAEFANCQLTEANVLSLRCSGCGRRIIVDGVHRLARLAAEKQFEALVHVVELSGRNWPPETPNFNIVCVCPKE